MFEEPAGMSGVHHLHLDRQGRWLISSSLQKELGLEPGSEIHLCPGLTEKRLFVFPTTAGLDKYLGGVAEEKGLSFQVLRSLFHPRRHRGTLDARSRVAIPPELRTLPVLREAAVVVSFGTHAVIEAAVDVRDRFERDRARVLAQMEDSDQYL